MEKEMQLLNSIMTPAIQGAIAEYTKWHVISAAGWLIFGALCIAGAWQVWKRREQFEESAPAAVCIAIILIVVGVATLPVNLPNLISPRAYAMHQLIKDVRGGK